MTSLAAHLTWLEHNETYTSACGRSIKVYRFNHNAMDSSIMSDWARHFRNHYCNDQEIRYLKNPTKTKSEYLITEKFPGESIAPGPSIRAGDFAEILIADYLQYIRNYAVPRTRYDRKIIANESIKGSDVIAFKKTPNVISENDELLIFEVKAKVTEKTKVNVLQNAIDDSVKDEVRIAESLNAMRQRLFDRRDYDGVDLIERFQREPDFPCKRKYGAAAVYTSSSLHESVVSASHAGNHPSADSLELLIVSGAELMSLIHELYRRAADEA
ncbi:MULTISPECIES: Hachiman antiphage defense system protein HamA [unclassified Pseudomonas]|uniref:Hachiman antiphage defense system protein HamA n=1 Tax=unclassified Pseudomonas TaxID=196821 RepID=UPI000C88D6EC|nr:MULTISPECIES: Hachiman antiphage defense system protein HamA [unclassified Pseudomonas]PNA05478.1 virulence associated protein [Pseudomonas sp. FW305-BF15]PNB80134.1 virulence associated protein [Pseudomonas sp. FW305-BF6]